MRRQSTIFIFLTLIFLLASFTVVSADEVIITYKDGVDSENSVSSSIGLEENLNVTHEFSIVDGFVADVSDEEKKLLEKNPEIIVSENTKHYLYLDNAVDNINASSVWNVQSNNTNITGAQQSVCVIDTGVDYTHAAFGGCTNETFLAGNCAKVIGGYDFINDDADPMDDHGHGTHVSGIISSQDSTYRGVAYGANIVSMKVFDESGIGGELADITAAMDWCINNASRFNITAISMSLGDGQFYQSTCTNEAYDLMVQSAVENNISVVAAAGNCDDNTSTTCDGRLGISMPACLLDVIPVGAVNNADTQYFQRWSTDFQVLAPGYNIMSAQILGSFVLASGTSMSTPFVSGTIALLQQYSKLKNNVSLNSAQIITALNTTSKWINDTATGTLYPRLDVYAALGTLTNPEFTSINHENLSTVNTTSPTIYLEMVFNEDVTFAYSINGSANKTGCISCDTFNQTIALPGFENLTFNFYIQDEVGNSNSTSRIIYINKSVSTYTDASYIGESAISVLTEDTIGQSVNLSNLTVYVNGTNNLSINYDTGNYTINLTDLNNRTIIEFNYTLNSTNMTLDLSNMILMKGNQTGNKSYLIVRGLNLTSQDRRKTIYLEKNIASNNTCVRDAVTFSINEFSEYCNDTSEYLITCPGSSESYSCSLVENNTYYKISGLSHSAVSETGDFCGDGIKNGDEQCDGGSSCDSSCQTISAPTVGGSPSGGGGGGGASIPRVNTIEPSFYEMREGYTTTVEKTDVILFKTTNGENHNITIDDIAPISIKLTVNSEPITLLLVAGEERRLNLTSSTFHDFYLKINLVSGDRANIFIQNIFEEIAAEETVAEEDEVEPVPIYRDIGAYLYLVTALIILILIFFINRKINKIEKENKRRESVFIKENEKKIKPKTKRKR